MVLCCFVYINLTVQMPGSNVGVLHQQMTHSKFLKCVLTDYQFSSLLCKEDSEDFETEMYFLFLVVEMKLILYSQPGFPGAVSSQWRGFATKVTNRKELSPSTLHSLDHIQWSNLGPTGTRKTSINQTELHRGPSKWSGVEHWPCEKRLEDQGPVQPTEGYEQKKVKFFLYVLHHESYTKYSILGLAIEKKLNKPSFCVCLKGDWKAINY